MIQGLAVNRQKESAGKKNKTSFLSLSLDDTELVGIIRDRPSAIKKGRSDNRGKINWLRKGEGSRIPLLGDVLLWVYPVFPGYLQRLTIRTIMRLEGGGLYSVTVRRILSRYHDVEVGMYTGLMAATKGAFPPGTRVGRYCSIDPSAKVYGGSHPTDTLSSHAFFYNPKLGYAKNDMLERTQPTIGNDVFIGRNCVITNKVSFIGDGAYIAAGSIVTKNVPPYALVAGNPARIVRLRFSPPLIRKMLQERWWEASIEELATDLARFQVPFEEYKDVDTKRETRR